MVTPLDGDDWLYPPYSGTDYLWGVILAGALVGLVVFGWKAVRTGRMTVENGTLDGWSAVALGWMVLLLGLGLGVLIAGALINHLFLEPPG